MANEILRYASLPLTLWLEIMTTCNFTEELVWYWVRKPFVKYKTLNLRSDVMILEVITKSQRKWRVLIYKMKTKQNKHTHKNPQNQKLKQQQQQKTPWLPQAIIFLCTHFKLLCIWQIETMWNLGFKCLANLFICLTNTLFLKKISWEIALLQDLTRLREYTYSCCKIC